MMIIKKINGYKNYYVTDDGRIFSGNRELHLYECNKHLCVYLYDEFHARKKHYVHDLVATAFIDNPNNYPIVNHKDENGLNNFVDNLEWCTHSYNTRYGSCIIKRAEKAMKKIMQYDTNGELLNVFNGIVEASKVVGIDPSSISKVAKHKRKTAGGFVWEYDS